METVPTSCGVVFKVGPFPWKQGKLNHACIYADYPSTEGHAICTANARLIAAAPDLLEQLRRLEMAANTVAYCYGKRPENFAAALQELADDAESARAAIAKATGAAS